MSSRRCNVLLTFAGRKGYQYLVLRSSPRAGTIVAADADPAAPIRVHGATLEVVPPVADPQAYLAALEVCVRRHSIDGIIPLNDRDAVLLATHSAAFASLGARYLGAEPEVAAALGDKLAAADWLASRGFQTPPTALAGDFPSTRSTAVAFPLVTKARHGQGSERFRVVRTEAELFAVPEGDVVQPFLHGEHYDLDILRSAAGRVVAVVPKRKLEMQGGTASLVRSDARQDLVDLGVRIGNAVRHVGMIDVDVIDAGGELHVLEVNPRLGGCFPFSCIVCPDLADALLAVGLGESPPDLVGRFRGGVTMFREWRYHEVPGSEDTDSPTS
ncbi:MAG: ATP-grasp domain-containing protein [Deltaproteobacteria bacterium]|nr:ATP-grasp domain-containing protein [Deltaproteobacteria bacterium]